MKNNNDNSTRPYTYDELVEAVKDYSAAKNSYDEQARMVEAKRKEMESFQKDADMAYQEVEKYKNRIRKIRGNMEP